MRIWLTTALLALAAQATTAVAEESKVHVRLFLSGGEFDPAKLSNATLKCVVQNGSTREEADNHEVLDICLKQIDECRPFFLGILGERYGWVSDRIPDRVFSTQRLTSAGSRPTF